MINLQALGISTQSIDAVFLSHNHFDHTNGLVAILKDNPTIPIYIHVDWDVSASYKGTNVPKDNRRVIQKARMVNEITPGLFLTNSHLSADYGGVHEQACYVKAGSSYVLICGCCHPGLNSFLSDRDVLEIPLDASIHILGGMHGFHFSNTKAQQLNPIIESITLCHCTQYDDIFYTQFGSKCSVGVVGRTVFF